mgnify:FL=1
MSTLAQITAAIDDDIRNKLPLVVKTEHADVEQLITDEMFPDSIVVEWDGDSQVSGLPNVECNASLTTIAKCTFKIYLTKHGNRVFYKGIITSTETVLFIGNYTMATFPTTLYKPLSDHSSLANITSLVSMTNNAAISISESGIKLIGAINASTSWQFEGSYKVTN